MSFNERTSTKNNIETPKNPFSWTKFDENFPPVSEIFSKKCNITCKNNNNNNKSNNDIKNGGSFMSFSPIIKPYLLTCQSVTKPTPSDKNGIYLKNEINKNKNKDFTLIMPPSTPGINSEIENKCNNYFLNRKPDMTPERNKQSIIKLYDPNETSISGASLILDNNNSNTNNKNRYNGNNILKDIGSPSLCFNETNQELSPIPIKHKRNNNINDGNTDVNNASFGKDFSAILDDATNDKNTNKENVNFDKLFGDDLFYGLPHKKNNDMTSKIFALKSNEMSKIMSKANNISIIKSDNNNNNNNSNISNNSRSNNVSDISKYSNKSNESIKVSFNLNNKRISKGTQTPPLFNIYTPINSVNPPLNKTEPILIKNKKYNNNCKQFLSKSTIQSKGKQYWRNKLIKQTLNTRVNSLPLFNHQKDINKNKNKNKEIQYNNISIYFVVILYFLFEINERILFKLFISIKNPFFLLRFF